MKIIKEGKIPNKKIILKCPECNTIFEADEGEYTKTKVATISSYTGVIEISTNLFVRFASTKVK